MNVRWTNSALAHLAAIHEHIAHDSPRYAANAAPHGVTCSQPVPPCRSLTPFRLRI
jgi:hypothetical protein